MSGRPPVRWAAIPNPFRVSSRIGYEITGPAAVRLELVDVHGRLVRRSGRERIGAGLHEAFWETRVDGVPAGVYYLRLQAEVENGGPIELSRALVLLGR